MSFDAILRLVGGRTLLERDRLAVLYDLTVRAARHAGAVAEVGVGRGGASRLLALALPHKAVYACDTFAGLPGEGEADLWPGRFRPQWEDLAWLRASENVCPVVGTFPDSLTWEMRQERFCLVHLDADLYRSTAGALDFFWPRLGGWLVLDDFGRPECPGVARAVRERGLEGHLWAHHKWLYQLVLYRSWTTPTTAGPPAASASASAT